MTKHCYLAKLYNCRNSSSMTMATIVAGVNFSIPFVSVPVFGIKIFSGCSAFTCFGSRLSVNTYLQSII